jgi:hypothetical protein
MVVLNPSTMCDLAAQFARPRFAASAQFLSIAPAALTALPQGRRYVGQLNLDFCFDTVPRQSHQT